MKTNKKPSTKETIYLVINLGGGVFMAWLFYKLYSGLLPVFGAEFGGIIDWVLVVFAFFVGVGLSNTINNAITKINK